METNKKRRPHYSWVIALAGLLIGGGGVGIFNSTLGVFIRPVCEELGFMRSQFALYSSISLIAVLILMPLFGSLFKRFGYKRVALICAAVCGLALVGYSFSSHLWQFYVFALISGLFVNGVGIMSIGILVNKWFDDKKGLATGIAYSGTGLMAALLIPIANYFIQAYGWRFAYQFLAGVSLFILIPIILFVVKDKPEEMGLAPYRTSSSGKTDVTDVTDVTGEKAVNGAVAGLTRSEAFRTFAFWLLALAALGIALSQAGPHIHIVAFISDKGYPLAFTSAISSGYMIILAGNKIAMGWIFDRLGSLKGSLLIGGCCVVFPVFALSAGTPAAAWVFALTLSIASSGSTILLAVLTANYFGRKDFARVFSVVSLFSTTGVAISSPSLGLIFDITGSYNLAWHLIIGIGVVVCGCLAGAYIKKTEALSI